MDKDELVRLSPELSAFLDAFEECAIAPTRRLIGAYVGGQLGPLPRKSVMPIARAAGIAPRTLQELLSLHRWDDGRMQRILLERVARRRAGPRWVSVIHETACLKKGDKTPGVALQPASATGRPANCCVIVHLAVADPPFRTVAQSELYLPERWIQDRELRATARIPEDVVYRSRSRIALDLVERVAATGVPLGTLLLGEGLGGDAALLRDLAVRGVRYVAALPRTARGWKGGARSSEKARTVEALAAGVALDWRVAPSPATDPRGPESFPAGSFPFAAEIDGAPGPEQQVILLRHPWSGEMRFLATDVPLTASVHPLAEAAFSRRALETLIDQDLAEIGLDHFEVRSHRSLLRHLTLSTASLLFLAEVRERPRGSPSGDTRVVVSGVQ